MTAANGNTTMTRFDNVREDDVAAALETGLKFLDELELAHRG